jgi:hypothetical protein
MSTGESGVGGIVVRATPAALGRIRAELRHVCGCAAARLVRDHSQALELANQPCEKHAPPAAEAP